MRIGTDQEIGSPTPNLLPTSREGCGRIQSGFPAPLFNRSIAELYTGLTGQGSLTVADELPIMLAELPTVDGIREP